MLDKSMVVVSEHQVVREDDGKSYHRLILNLHITEKDWLDGVHELEQEAGRIFRDDSDFLETLTGSLNESVS